MNTAKTVPNYDEVQNGVTWIGGTSHELQQQRIPGYQGHVHGLFSENVFGRSFARVTAECINQKHQKGIDHSIDDRYSTSYKCDFVEPDNRKKQFINTAENLLVQTEQREKQINESIKKQYQKQPKSIQQVAPIDRIPVVGYKGFKPVFRPPKRNIQAPNEPAEIKLKEKEVLQQMLRTGDLDEKNYQKQAKQEPVVGYTGFLKGVKAENQYAQVYRDVAINSIRR